MARYSNVNILDKYMILLGVLKDFSAVSAVSFTKKPVLHSLLAIRYLNKRRMRSDMFHICMLLRSNWRSIGYPDLDAAIKLFLEAGYVQYKGVQVFITEVGKSVLIELERELRTSHYRTSKRKPVRLVVPGPKKGCVKPVQFG